MTRIKEIIQAPVFEKQKKKLHKQDIQDLDNAVRAILADPALGDMKKGDLQGIQVYKFRSGNGQTLLAYKVSDSTLFLYAFGSHENFYRDLKKYLQK